MHRSRLGQVVIDCDDADTGVAFWSGVLGTEPYDAGGGYVGLKPEGLGLVVLVQPVPEPKSCKSRMHLDVETEDVLAEARRLEALGARLQRDTDGFRVMEDPCGNEFCVVPPETSGFPARTKHWGSHRSRLGSIGIDSDDLEAGIRFWSAALGVGATQERGGYVDLAGDVAGLRVFLQSVPEPNTCKSTVHVQDVGPVVGSCV